MLSQRNRYGEIAKPAIKLTLSLITVGIIGSVVLGILDTVPISSFAVASLANAGIGFLSILILLFFGTEVSIAVKRAFKSCPELFTIAYSLFQVLAILIGFVTFRSVFDLVLPEWSWAYSLIFLAVALIPGIRAAIVAINSVDKWVDHRPRQEG